MAAESYIGAHTVVRLERWHCEPYVPLAAPLATAEFKEIDTDQYAQLSEVIGQMEKNELQSVEEWNRHSREASRNAYAMVRRDFEKLGASDVKLMLLTADWCFVQTLFRNYTPLMQIVSLSLGWSGPDLGGRFERERCLSSEVLIDQLKHKIPGISAFKAPDSNWGCELGIHRSYLTETPRPYFEKFFSRVYSLHKSLFNF